jgi:hypothetical protein
MNISLLTGGADKHYASGLLSSLINHGVEVQYIGSDELYDEKIVSKENVTFHNLYGSRSPKAPINEKNVSSYQILLEPD